MHQDADRAPPAGLPPGTAGHVDHVGIAVRDLDEAVRLYRDLLGLELERIEEVPVSESVPTEGPMLAIRTSLPTSRVSSLTPATSTSSVIGFASQPKTGER